VSAARFAICAFVNLFVVSFTLLLGMAGWHICSILDGRLRDGLCGSLCLVVEDTLPFAL
jgi:hypothetical protein